MIYFSNNRRRASCAPAELWSGVKELKIAIRSALPIAQQRAAGFGAFAPPPKDSAWVKYLAIFIAKFQFLLHHGLGKSAKRCPSASLER
jgi:hypothetical protein